MKLPDDLSAVEVQAIHRLRKAGPAGLMASLLGNDLWRKKQTFPCNNAYARPAGKLLKRLYDRQLVDYHFNGPSKRWTAR